MGMISSIGAKLSFLPGSFFTGIGKAEKKIKTLEQRVAEFERVSASSGLSIKELVEVMRADKGPDQFQRNIQLVNQSLRTFTTISKEARVWAKFLWKSFAKPVSKSSGLKTIKNEIKEISHVAKQAHSDISGVITAFAGLGAGMVGLNLAGGLKDAAKEAVSGAAKLEANKLTFDVMLGDKEKSAKLMKSVLKYAQDTPFGQTDIIESSKLLLNITRDNIEENQRLFKLAANIAALRPGREVKDVAQGIVQATAGEFEILKSSFGVFLNAEMFKKHGAAGSEKYVAAVTKEIEEQFARKTRGADLVGALAQTFIGQMAKLEDAVEMFSQAVGQQLIDTFNIKEGMMGLAGFIEDVTFAFKAFTGQISLINSNEDMLKFMEISPWAREIGSAMADFSKVVKTTFKWVITNVFIPTEKFMKSLSTTGRRAFLAVSAAMGGLGISSAVVVPMLGMLGVVVSALVTTFSAGLIPAFKGVLAALGTFFAMIPPITFVVGLAAAAFGFLFYMFRNEGESAFDTVKRFASGVWDALYVIGYGAYKMAASFIKGFSTPFNNAMTELDKIMARLKIPIREFFSYFSGQPWGGTLAEFFDMENVGWAIGMMLRGLVKLMHIFDLLSWGLERMSNNGYIKSIASDFIWLGRALSTIFTQDLTMKTVLKSMNVGLRAMADIVTLPFRLIIGEMISIVQNVLMKMSSVIQPLNAQIAAGLVSTSNQLNAMRASVKEGFLSTVIVPPVVNVKVPVSTQVDLKLDGKKVAEALSESEMRGRHGGRGGNPVNDDEIGFVLQGGGSSIKTIGLSEAGDFL